MKRKNQYLVKNIFLVNDINPLTKIPIEMKRITLLIMTVLSCTLFAFGQPEEAKVEQSLLSIYFIPLKITYEQGLGKSNTLEIGGGLTGVTWLENTGDFDEFRFGIAPFAETTFRNYYNLEKRQGKGKRTAMNSGNYWGIHARYNFEAIAGDTDHQQFRSFFIAPVWGFQRNYNSQFSLGMDFGLGAGFNDDGAYFSPLIRLKLGFVLFSHAGK
jgi:hypothetical protein